MSTRRVSFCVMCYNQEELIEEALRSAFAQTYENLEIVVSDDASTDGSWAIIERMARDYKGPHTLIIQRHETNLGLTRNLLSACARTTGELIFQADGDDTSHPTRVARVVADWEANGCEALMMRTSYNFINIQNQYCGSQHFKGGWDDYSLEKHLLSFYTGASIVFHRRVFEAFPAVSNRHVQEDSLLYLRAILTAPALNVHHRFRTLDECLVNYRIGRGMTSLYTNYWQSRAEIFATTRASCLQAIEDTKALNLPNAAFVQAKLAARAEALQATITLFSSLHIGTRLKALRHSHLYRFAGIKGKILALLAVLQMMNFTRLFACRRHPRKA